ncbi:hypothetical protein RLEG12_02220 (plasmid) [Rhizobium leguminosarum bv. trifolii CB782]|uniref:Uncharacterized protein n=1 Tax=Rhizobium hidalgonense TaxID=1538159 RepID=A0ABX4JKZ9_9HYPH|nr:hypothetical protein RLEG12_02220 [Rhizobium leguminosarum bv. trifolii CB782]PDT20707.1 hypothetical protein CO674_26160 [Rhizobium hidalgonense]PON06941.1 hypothetical protein ATY29_13815 [Rhizobium hidalgonense]
MRGDVVSDAHWGNINAASARDVQLTFERYAIILAKIAMMKSGGCKRLPRVSAQLGQLLVEVRCNLSRRIVHISIKPTDAEQYRVIARGGQALKVAKIYHSA